MRKYMYLYDSNNVTLRTTNIKEFITKVNMVENLDKEQCLTRDKLHNYFCNKTKKPNEAVSRCIRARI